jgi:hypothetical protein
MIMDWNYGTFAGETSQSSNPGDGSRKISFADSNFPLHAAEQIAVPLWPKRDFCVAIFRTQQHIATTPKNGAIYESQTFSFP